MIAQKSTRVANVFDHFLPLNLPVVYETLMESEKQGISALVLSLKRTNQEAFPFSPTYSFHSLNILEKNWYRLKGIIGNTSYALPYWEKIIRRERPSLLHAHFIWVGRECLRLKKRTGIPMILTLYGED